MDQGELRDQISRLEQRIEDLTAALEKSRKAIMMSKVALAAGGLLTLTMLSGAMSPQPLAVVAAVAAIFGGLVGYGANVSTARQDRSAMLAAQAARADLISRLELREVGRPDCGSVLCKR